MHSACSSKLMHCGLFVNINARDILKIISLTRFRQSSETLKTNTVLKYLQDLNLYFNIKMIVSKNLDTSIVSKLCTRIQVFPLSKTVTIIGSHNQFDILVLFILNRRELVWTGVISCQLFLAQLNYNTRLFIYFIVSFIFWFFLVARFWWYSEVRVWKWNKKFINMIILK